MKPFIGLTGIKIREQDTRHVAAQQFRQLAYPPDHPYHYETDGTVQTISALTRDELVDFHRRQYGPRGMVIVVVGAVEAEQADLQTRLGDTNLYLDGRKQDLANLLKREGELKARASQLEETWLEQQEALEALAQA